MADETLWSDLEAPRYAGAAPAQGRDRQCGDLDRLQEIHCPSLVVAAAQDQLRSLDEARELQAGISGATLEIIENSGHMIPIEAPGQLAAVVVPWLAQYAN
jgi:pimeloyl-ACP methyl ester carboxylesterase